MRVLQIFRDGSMDEIEVSPVNMMDTFMKKSRSHGEGDIRYLYNWVYNQFQIECYGWFDGEAGFENKHELPPSGCSSFLEDSSCQLLFGDVFFTMKKDTLYKDIDVGEYSEFYSYIHGGFDDCDDTDGDMSEPDTPMVDEDYTDGEEEPTDCEDSFTETEGSELDMDTSEY